MEYLNTVPDAVPDGKILVHDRVYAGPNGVRTWLAQPDPEKYTLCECGCSGPKHYRFSRDMTQNYGEADPRQHTANIKRMLNETITHLREDEHKVAEPKAQALFETTAEVLAGLVTAYEHYERTAEPAWQR
jgi:hypothetical protein